MLMRFLLGLFILSLASCSTYELKESAPTRLPAQSKNECHELIKSIYMKDNYVDDFEQALLSKKLLSFSNKFVTIDHPKLEWMNKARLALSQTIKNWNTNKYPAFYLFHEEDSVTQAKNFFQNRRKAMVGKSKLSAEESQNVKLVKSWMNTYQNYQKELDHLLDERVSLQYNVKILKKLKLKKDETRDIKIFIQRNGKMVEEIHTLRQSDGDLKFLIKKLEAEIKAFDGSLISNGKIKDRVIRQAALRDMLTIVHREYEYGVKNFAPHSKMLQQELENLFALIGNEVLEPTTYGVYKVSNQIFLREVIALSKLDVGYKKFLETPLLKFKDVIVDFIKKRKLKDKDAEGIFKKLYAKVTSITPTQAAIGAAVTTTVAVSTHQYFWITEENMSSEQQGSESETLEETNEVIANESLEQSIAIEASLEELTHN